MNGIIYSKLISIQTLTKEMEKAGCDLLHLYVSPGCDDPDDPIDFLATTAMSSYCVGAEYDLSDIDTDDSLASLFNSANREREVPYNEDIIYYSVYLHFDDIETLKRKAKNRGVNAFSFSIVEEKKEEIDADGAVGLRVLGVNINTPGKIMFEEVLHSDEDVHEAFKDVDFTTNIF